MKRVKKKIIEDTEEFSLKATVPKWSKNGNSSNKKDKSWADWMNNTDKYGDRNMSKEDVSIRKNVSKSVLRQ